jgi:transposase-like protein
MSPVLCAHCGSPQTVKAGHNRSGTQRYQCRICHRYSTPQPKEQGHGADTQALAVRLYLEGTSLRGTGRVLGVVHQSVANWVAAAAGRVPTQVADAQPTQTIEIDELETFIGGEGAHGRDHGRRRA